MSLRRCDVSSRGLPTRSQDIAAKRHSSVVPVRSVQPATGKTAQPFRLQTSKSQPTNGDAVFDAKTFLARSGFGRKILNLKKGRGCLRAR